MLVINGKTYPTISDAAKALGNVSSKTVREWIRKKVIPRPPTLTHGLRTIMYFPPEYLEQAKAALERYHKQKAEQPSI